MYSRIANHDPNSTNDQIYKTLHKYTVDSDTAPDKRETHKSQTHPPLDEEYYREIRSIHSFSAWD